MITYIRKYTAATTKTPILNEQLNIAGDTVALVSVNGPLDTKMGSQSIDKATLEVLFSTKSGKPSVAER